MPPIVQAAADQRRDVGLVNRLQVQRSGPGGNIGAVGRQRHLAQCFSVQSRPHRLAVAVQHRRAGPRLRVRDVDLAARLVAKADGQDFHAAFGRRLGRVDRVRVVVFAVGDQNDHSRDIGLGTKAVESLADRLLEARAASAHTGRTRAVQDQPEKSKIGRQRAQNGRPAGEGDQTDLVALQVRQQIGHFRFRPLEPVRGRVFGQHRLADVQADHDLRSDAGRLLVGQSPLRPRQRHDQRRAGQSQAADAQPPPRPGRPVNEPQLHGRRQETGQYITAPPVEPEQQRRHPGDQPQGVKPVRIGELKIGHGNRC